MTISGSKGRLSQLQASFERIGGVTRLAGRYHTSPIKIAKSFALGESAGVLIMDVSPGMLEGDRYELEWRAGRDTHVQLSNQSFLKVHPCPGGGEASVRQSFVLEENAVLEHMPEPVMLYGDASFRADTVVRLAPGSCWMQAEVLCPGRSHRNERFRYRSLDSCLTVYEGQELIYRQRQRVIPGEQLLRAPGCWQDMTHWGTLCLFGAGIDDTFAGKMQEALDELAPIPNREVVSGLSLTWRNGLVVQAAGRSAWTLQRCLEAAWLAARSQWSPRLSEPMRK